MRDDLRVRLGPRDAVHQPAHDRAADGADPVPAHRRPARPLTGQPRRLVLQPLHRRQQHACPFEDQLAQRGRPGAAAVANEERTPEGPLDALQLGGQRRLGETQLRCGLGHAAGLRDRAHHPEVPQLEVHSVTVGRSPDGG
jgi:hypothetical protein